MKKTVYILGAGASYAYDQSPTGVRPPLARGFFQAYKDLPISEDLDVRVGDLINRANWVGKSVRRLWNRLADPRNIANM
ncbi:hypothetical protein ES708_19874 [subsurface metagenome]